MTFNEREREDFIISLVKSLYTLVEHLTVLSTRPCSKIQYMYMHNFLHSVVPKTMLGATVLKTVLKNEKILSNMIMYIIRPPPFIGGVGTRLHNIHVP